jgi:hypothetical protein
MNSMKNMNRHVTLTTAVFVVCLGASVLVLVRAPASPNGEEAAAAAQNGKYLYSFGFQGDAPGGFWGEHQFNVDQEGNLYIAEVPNGRVQKFRPLKGADPAKLVAKPIYDAWQR